MSADFHLFAKAVEARFQKISGGELYVVDTDDIFAEYLGAFPPGCDPIFRERTEHDCSCCKNFVRNLGAVVALKAGQYDTVWDHDRLPEPYATVAVRMARYVRSRAIKGLFRTKEGKFGAEKTIEMLEDKSTRVWKHFWSDVPTRYVTANADAQKGEAHTNLGVFKRGMEEITVEAIATVLDLIESNAIYRGAEFKRSVEDFRALHTAYPRGLDVGPKAIFLWTNLSNRSSLLRNTVIGTLLTDLSDGVELDKAVRSFEQKVAPMNYKRPTALITPKMVEQGVEKLRELGLETAIDRRFANLRDVSVNNVLWVDNSVRGLMKDSLTTLLMSSAVTSTPDLKTAPEIPMSAFLADVVPTAQSIELLLEGKHMPNFMSLTAPVDPAAGRLFKWDNNFAWSYDGDATDSIKARVKAAGGNVEAQLRVSLAWSNTDDLDLHVYEPLGHRNMPVHFGMKQGLYGALDVDMNCYGKLVRNPVENYAVPVGKRLSDGVFRVDVNNFNQRETVDFGFTLEVEYAGAVTHYHYSKALRSKMTLQGALQITVKGGVVVSVKPDPLLSGTAQSQEKWGVKTETLVAVNTLMASPNHWDGQEIGNKHWFFILKDCVNPEPARGIYNEFLKGELEPHRKVFEVLGARTKAPSVPDQLSGVGFSSTRGDTVKVLVKSDKTSRAYNIKF